MAFWQFHDRTCTSKPTMTFRTHHAVLGGVFVYQYLLPFQQRLECPEVILHESCIAGKRRIIHLGLPK